jgi:hypothetical protein
MEITILVDHDLEGDDVFLAAGLKETGWDELIRVEFKRLRDYGLPANLPDQDIWRFVQQHRLLLATNNRNSDGETSLQATLQRENQPDSLPIITLSDRDALALADYRQRVAQSLVRIIIDLDDYLGAGRLWVP